MPFPVRPDPWVPKFDIKFIGPFVVTCKLLIERDQVEALAWAATEHSIDKVLKPFQHVLLARRQSDFWKNRVESYPAAVVAPVQSVAPTNTDGNYVDELNRIIVELAITGSDPDALTIDAMAYVAAVDQIWRAASVADMSWNLKPGHHTEVVNDVTSHDYPIISTDGPNAYIYTLGLTLTTEFKEG